EALDMVKSLLNYLPDQQGSSPKKLPYKAESDDENRSSLIEIVPYDDRSVYDVKKVIEEIVDEIAFLNFIRNLLKISLLDLLELEANPLDLFVISLNIWLEV